MDAIAIAEAIQAAVSVVLRLGAILERSQAGEELTPEEIALVSEARKNATQDLLKAIDDKLARS